MEENKVVIKSITVGDTYDAQERTEIYVNDKLIGSGCYGGEPEDNRRDRDYDWVESVLKILATILGAEVEIIKIKEEA